MKPALPANIEAEQALLGILLIGSEESWDEVSNMILPSDFYQTAHKKIFKEMQDLYLKEGGVDAVTLGDKLKKADLLDAVGGTAYLADLIHKLPSTTNASSYAKIIKEKSILRHIIESSQTIITQAKEEDFKNVDDFVDEIEGKMLTFTKRSQNSDPIPISKLVDSGLKRLEHLFNSKEEITGLPSGFYDLDSLTSGFQPSELIILAARPSMGKTALSLNIALHQALNGKKVAIFSLEMSREQILLRLLSQLAKINLSRLVNGQVGEEAWASLIQAAGRLSETHLFIDDSSPLSPYEIRSKSRRLKAKEGLDFIIIDYLQLMNLTKKTESREREVSEMSRLLKSFAKELNIPILTLSQLNRSVEARSNRRPILSDLRESGAIEQDADLITMLYRADYYEEGEPTHEAELIINKHRNGPTGTVTLNWVAEYGSFENRTPQSGSPYPDKPPEAPDF